MTIGVLCFILTMQAAPAASPLIVMVTDANHVPIAGATIVLTAQTTQRAQTDGRGKARFALPQTGTYTLRVSANGFLPSTTTATRDQKSINIVLKASARSLRVIGSVTGHARAPFNATPTSQKVYPREAYRDQGQPSVASVMNQTPGALALTSTSTNPAVPLAPAFPSVRNALPFETPVLIDGVPIETPSGTLDLSLLPTYVLQEVEIVKGPGDVGSAGGGVGGAINFRTAEPTLGMRGTFETEGDSRGGSFTDLAYDGTQPGGAFSYATMLSVDGSPCCAPDPSDYARKAMLVKLRDTPNPSLSITGTLLSTSLDRSLESIYGFAGPGYEHLGFGDLTASLDRGSDAYSAHVFLAQTQQGDVAPNPSAQPLENESGVELTWLHASGPLSFATTGRAIDTSLASTTDNETHSFAQESISYRPDARREIDLSGSLSADDSPQHRAFSGANGRIGYSQTLHAGLALRGSYGTSLVAPPLDTLLVTPLSTNTIENPERSTGYDAGLEWRLHGNTTTLSADVYRNNTQGVYVLNNLNWTNGPPMTESGVEFTLQQFKRVGLGFIAALSLPRTYTAGSVAGMILDGANLGAVPGIAPFRIPYAQGYTEISYKWPHGSRASLGALYVGSNNVYNARAFATLNSNLELSLGARAKLQFSIENLTGALRAYVPMPIAGSFTDYGLQPRTLRFMFRQSFGTGSLYEH